MTVISVTKFAWITSATLHLAEFCSKVFFHLFIHSLLGLSKGNARVEILFFSLVYLLKVVELAVSDREIWELVKSNYAWIILFYDCTSINHGVENDHCVLWFQLRK